MIRLRRLAIVLVAIGLVTSAIYATGAFSSLSTSRNADVSVVGDKAGYLGLTPGENGEYTTYQNGELQLRLSGALEEGDAPGGGGVNRDAETTIESVFIITNQGAQSVGVWLDDTNDAIAFERESGASLEGKDNAVQLDPGDPVAVSVRIDTRQATDDTLETDLTINADQGVEGVTVGEDSSGDSEGGQSDGESQSGEEKKDDSDNSEEDCGRWDVNCHMGDPIGKGSDRIFTDDGNLDLDGNEKDDVEQVTDPIPDVDISDAGEGVQSFTTKLRGVYNPHYSPKVNMIVRINIANTYPPAEKRLYTEAGYLDPTGNGDPYFEDINSRIRGIPRNDYDGDGVNDSKEPLDRQIHPYLDHDDFPILRGINKGAIYGEGGTPGGDFYKPNCDSWNCTSKHDATSVQYLVGQIGSGFAPLLGAPADARDAHQNYKKGNRWLSLLDASGIVLTGLDEGSTIISKASKIVPSSRAREIHNPPNSKSKHLLLLDRNNGKTASKLHDNGMSVNKIDESMGKGYDVELMNKQIDEGIPAKHMEQYVDIGMSPSTIARFRKANSNPEDIKKLVDHSMRYGSRVKGMSVSAANYKQEITLGGGFYGVIMNYCMWEKNQPNTDPDIKSSCKVVNPENSAT